MLFVASCGGPVPAARPQAVADEGYVLSLTRVNLVEREAPYHFQLCPLRAVDASEGAATALQVRCFNPFEERDGSPVVFTAVPATGGLRIRGVGGKALRYVTGTAALLGFVALACVLTPKAARLAFTKLWTLHKMGDADIARYLDDLSKSNAERTWRKASTKNPDLRWEDHLKSHREGLAKMENGLRLFRSRPALFFTSLFIVGGTVEAWRGSYGFWRNSNAQLAKWNWGQAELDLASAYPFIVTSDASEPYRVTSIEQLLVTLREYFQLIFSADYLREFPPPQEEMTTGPPRMW